MKYLIFFSGIVQQDDACECQADFYGKIILPRTPVDRDWSQLLFQVISDSYENKSLILTTNLEFSKWGTVFTDDQMAAAMIDRFVHHGHLLIFDKESYRMEHALMKQTVIPTDESC